jgi:hypothetical protein
MQGFQKFILFSAIVILIIALIIIGIALTYSKNQSWPPMVANCPDYWVVDGSGNNTTCTNVKDLGTCSPFGSDKHLVMNFNEPAFTGSQGDCNKYKWANKCGVSWDGLTYGVSNPCSS